MFVLVAGLALSLTWAMSATAQGPQPTPAPGKSPGLSKEQFAPGQKSPNNQRSTPGPYGAPMAPKGPRSPKTVSGQDNFGYYWDDSVAFAWVDATAGTNTGITGDDVTGLVSLPFSFNYYENAYTQVYISTNGILVFGQNDPGCCNFSIPSPSTPNNVIAPFWTDLTVGSPYNSGAIYTLSGGTAPNRYFVVEWQNVTGCCATPATDYKTFEVVLYENGNILMQYQTIPAYQYPVIGIEDSMGTDGLQYWNGAFNGNAVRFYRPSPSARIKAGSLTQGRFTKAGNTESFQFWVRNIGDLGADIYDLTTTSTWPVSLYAADGTTLLTDTNGNTKVDTGSLAQGGVFTITAKVQTPSTANVGDSNTVTFTIASSLNTSKIVTGTLQTGVPTSFAQVYRDDSDGAMSLYLVQPTAQTLRKATSDNYWGSDMAVIQAPSGNFIYAWSRERSFASTYVAEIEYALLDANGNPKPVSKLTDLSAATMNTYDYSPAVAAAPNGRIGFLWYRQVWNNNTNQYNLNIYLAVLDSAGNVILAPTNLTNNTTWGTGGKFGFISFSNPRIVATGDNRFVLAWQMETLQAPAGSCTSGCYVDDIYYAVRDSGGGEVRGVTKFTNDTPGWDEAYYTPNLATLSGNKALLTWQRSSNGDIYYAVLDSSGTAVRTAANLVDDSPMQNPWDSAPDAVQLSDGKTAVAWESSICGYIFCNGYIRFAVLDTSYNRIAGPTLLNSSPISPPSIAADRAGRAVITWSDASWGAGLNLYYALVGSNGSVLTQPMSFRSSQIPNYSIETSTEGYGNTSNSFNFIDLPLILR